MSLLTPSCICFLLQLLAFSGFTADELTRSIYPGLSLLSSGREDDWRNDTDRAVTHEPEITLDPADETLASTYLPVEMNSTFQTLGPLTQTSNQLDSIYWTETLGDEPITTSSSVNDLNAIEDNTVVDSTTESIEKTSGFQESLITINAEKSNPQFLQKSSSETEFNVDNEKIMENYPAERETRVFTRTTIFPDEEPSVQRNKSVFETDNANLMTRRGEPYQTSPLILLGFLTQTSKPWHHYEEGIQDTEEKPASEESPIDGFATKIPLPTLLTRRSPMIEDEARYSGSDVNWRTENSTSSSSVGLTTENSISSDTKSELREPDKKFEYGERKSKDTQTRFTDPHEEVLDKKASRDGIVTRSSEETAKEEEKDHLVHQNIEERVPSRKSSENIVERVRKGDEGSDISVDEVKRTELSLLEILKDTIAIEGQRLNADGNMLRGIGEILKKVIILYRSILTVQCGRNTVEETFDQYLHSPLNRPLNQNAASPAPFQQIPQEMLDNSDESSDKFSLKYVLKSAGPFHFDHILSRTGQTFNEDQSNELFPLLQIPKIKPAMKWVRVCHTIEILPGIICRSIRSICDKDNNGNQMNCGHDRIACGRYLHDSESRSMKLICQNVLMMVNNTAAELLALRKRCNMNARNIRRWYSGWEEIVDQEDERDKLPSSNPPGLEEAEQLYRNESEVEWRMGVVTEKLSLPEDTEDLIVITGPDFIESAYSKKVPARRSFAALLAQQPKALKEILLGAIRQAMRDDEKKTSEKKIEPPHLDRTPMSLDSESSNINFQHSFKNESLPSTLHWSQDAASKAEIFVNTENNVKREQLKIDEDTTNSIVTANTRNITPMASFVNASTAESVDAAGELINQDLIRLNNESSQLSEVAAGHHDDIDKNHTSDRNINKDSVLNLKHKLQFPMTLADNTEIADKSLVAESDVSVMNTTRTEILPVEYQPVAVGLNVQVMPETITTRDVVETSKNMTDIKTRRSDSSTMTDDLPLGFDVKGSDNPVDIINEILQRLSGNLHDLQATNENIQSSHGANMNNRTNVHDSHNQRKSSDIRSSMPTHLDANQYYNSTNDTLELHGNVSESVNGVPVSSTIEYLPASPENNIIITGERDVNIETDLNANISTNHNANFNQSIAEVQSARGEPIRIALPTPLGSQELIRSISPNTDEAFAMSLNANTSNSVVHTSLLSDEDHRINLSSNDITNEGEILSMPKTQTMASEMINLDAKLHDVAATVDLGVQPHVNQEGQFALNQNANISAETDVLQNSNVSVSHDASFDLNRNMILDAGGLTNINTKTYDKTDSNSEHVSGMFTNVTSLDSQGLGFGDNAKSSVRIEIEDVSEGSIKMHETPQMVQLNVPADASLQNINRFSSVDDIYNDNSTTNISLHNRDGLEVNPEDIRRGVKQAGKLIGGTINAITGNTLLNSINVNSAIEATRPIINAHTMIPGALNSIDGFVGTGIEGTINSMRRPIEPSNERFNMRAVNSSGTSADSNTTVQNTSDTQKVHSLWDSMNTNYASDSEYNSDSANDMEVGTTKFLATSKFDIAESSDINNQQNGEHTGGWYELWYNRGDEQKNDWMEVWNNKRFKRFLGQQQSIRNKEIGQANENSAITPISKIPETVETLI